MSTNSLPNLFSLQAKTIQLRPLRAELRAGRRWKWCGKRAWWLHCSMLHEQEGALHVLLSGAMGSLNEATLIDALQNALAAQGAIVPSIRIQRVKAIPRNVTGKAPLIVSHVSLSRE